MSLGEWAMDLPCGCLVTRPPDSNVWTVQLGPPDDWPCEYGHEKGQQFEQIQKLGGALPNNREDLP